MTDRDRAILSLSDAELLMFHAIGGTVPALKRGRVEELMKPVVAELAMVTPKSVPRPQGPPNAYPTRKRWQRPRSNRLRIAA